MCWFVYVVAEMGFSRIGSLGFYKLVSSFVDFLFFRVQLNLWVMLDDGSSYYSTLEMHLMVPVCFNSGAWLKEVLSSVLP